MEKKLISVIVPVYNVEKYIKKCIDSILAQVYNYFELILIDDGSKDNSGKICDEYKNKDTRIKVLHQKNAGLSAARNRGLDEAVGDYICFIDSDDYIKEDYLEVLLNCLSDIDADMSFCDIESPKLTKAYSKMGEMKIMTSSDARKWLYDPRSREYVLMVVAYNKLYKKSLFQDLRYPEGMFHEDEFMILPLINRCKTIVFISERLYHYEDNPKGITAAANMMNIKHLDGVDALIIRLKQLLESGDKEFAVVTLKNALYKCAKLYGDSIELKDNDMRDASMKKYKEIYFIYKGVMNFKQKMKYLIFCVSPVAFIKKYNP